MSVCKYALLSILFPLVLLLSGCEKDEPFTEIRGRVYELGTNKSIPNAAVRFEWWDPGVYGQEKFHVDSTRADAQGNYKLSGEVPVDQQYYVIAKAPQYFLTEETEVMSSNVKRGESQTVNLDLIPYAWIRMHITSTGEWNRMNINSLGLASNPIQVRAGADTIIVSDPVYGNSEEVITMFKYRWEEREIENLPVQTIGHDTVDVYLSF